jgi:hypothetical protein
LAPSLATPQNLRFKYLVKEGGGGRVRSEKWSHKNAIKHGKGDTPGFSDSLKETHSKEFGQNPKDPPGPPWISILCASMHGVRVMVRVQVLTYFGSRQNSKNPFQIKTKQHFCKKIYFNFQVFTKIENYIPWILENIKNHEDV